jgi:hypothetical protein
MLKIPRELMTCPRPPQVEQVFAVEPGSAPEPRQDSHGSSFVTGISFSQPSTASSNVISMSYGGRRRAAARWDRAARRRTVRRNAAGAAAEDFPENLKRIVEPATARASGARA